jgi:hypothetical protein
MASSQRHRWLYAHVSECFGLETRVVEEQGRAGKNAAALTDFFASEGLGKLFCYYQERTLLSAGGDWVTEGKEKYLTFTLESRDQRLIHKCAYFIKTKPGRLDMTKASDTAVIFGEVTHSTLHDLEAQLSQMYRPLLATRSNWGKAEQQHQGEFLAGVDHFLSETNDLLKALQGRLQLTRPNELWDLAAIAKRDGASLDKSEQQAQLGHYQELMGNWCAKIDEHLRGQSADAVVPDPNGGPMDEYDVWSVVLFVPVCPTSTYPTPPLEREHVRHTHAHAPVPAPHTHFCPHSFSRHC